MIVFAKAPRPGEVKTRLIPALGAEGAAALHARLIMHTLAMATGALRGAVELHGTPADDDFLRHCAARYHAPLVEQSGSDLGERMCAAFEDVFRDGTCRSAVLIGSDSPALTQAHLKQALRALDVEHDAVIAPAEDGGYVLIGVKRADRQLFAGVSWSSANVMAETRARLRQLSWRWMELETLWDVDRPADYERLVASGLLNSR